MRRILKRIIFLAFIAATSVIYGTAMKVHYLEQYVLSHGGKVGFSDLFQNWSGKNEDLVLTAGKLYKAEEISAAMARAGQYDFCLNGESVRIFNDQDLASVDQILKRIQSACPDQAVTSVPVAIPEGIPVNMNVRKDHDALTVDLELIVFQNNKGRKKIMHFIMPLNRNQPVAVPALTNGQAAGLVYLTNVKSNLADAVYSKGGLTISVKVILRRKLDTQTWLVENPMSGRIFQAKALTEQTGGRP